MNSLRLMSESLSVKKPKQNDVRLNVVEPTGLKRANNRQISYTARHRSQFFRPEYDFDEIQIAESVDSFLFRAIQKKTNRILTAGWKFVGRNVEAVEYIERRIAEIERVSNFPFRLLMSMTIRDLFRFSNCFWVKVRNIQSSSGKKRRDYRGVEVDPVAGYFPLAIETLHFRTKDNGDLVFVEQRMPDGEKKRFHATDIVHFYTNKNPGWAVGTPELYPALDDISLLRHIEENVSELIESSLFPFMHYKVGTEDSPERHTEQGIKESEAVKRKLEYMPAGGIWVSDHRHEIVSVGVEGRSLRAEQYLDYFKKRVFAAIGISPVDLGEGGDANRSTASTMTKATMVDIEAMQTHLKCFLEFFVVEELLMEGGYNPLNPDDRVQIQFGIIDREERNAAENQTIQKFLNNLITADEAREELGRNPMSDLELERTYSYLFNQPDALSKGLSPGSAAGETLAGHPSSPITPQAVEKEKKFATQLEKERKAGQVGNPNSKSNGASGNQARPANQHGTRTAPKSNRDLTIKDSAGNEFYIDVTDYSDLNDQDLLDFAELVHNRWELLKDTVSFNTLVKSMLWRLEEKL